MDYKANKIKAMMPVHKRDINTVQSKLKYCYENLPISGIDIITQKSVVDIMSGDQRTHYYDEDRLYEGLSYAAIEKLLNARGGNKVFIGWYLQQFLKMAYAFKCNEDYYLIWDGDLIPLRRIDLFDKETGKPYVSKRTEHHKPYFRTIERLFDGRIKKEVDFSYISEHMVVKSSIMRALIRDIENNTSIKGKYFYEKIINSISDEDINMCGFSEYETYGNYAHKLDPYLYIPRLLSYEREALILIGRHLNPPKYNWMAESLDMAALETKGKPSIISFFVNNSFFYRRYSFTETMRWYNLHLLKTERNFNAFIEKIKNRVKIIIKYENWRKH